MAYLADHGGHRQYRTNRRAPVNGQITIHTAESFLDRLGPDAGAESVARFIAARKDHGSYHRIGDRDSVVVMAPFEHEVWHDATRYPDGTRANSRSVGLALAMRAADWPTLSQEHRAELLTTLVEMAVDAAVWYRDVHGIAVPARRLTRAESNRHLPGFIGHGDRDPGRRSDPGLLFPWEAFLWMFAARMARAGGGTPAGEEEGDDMAKLWQIDQVMASIERIYQAYGRGGGESNSWYDDVRKKLRAGVDIDGTVAWIDDELARQARP